MSNQSQLNDIDPIETREWLEALEAVHEQDGAERIQFLLEQLAAQAKRLGANVSAGLTTPYINTISPDAEEKLPEQDREVLQRLIALLRWNAMAIVLRAGKKAPELGGHIATYASSPVLY